MLTFNGKHYHHCPNCLSQLKLIGLIINETFDLCLLESYKKYIYNIINSLKWREVTRAKSSSI